MKFISVIKLYNYINIDRKKKLIGFRGDIDRIDIEALLKHM